MPVLPKASRRLWLTLVCLVPAPSVTIACGGDVCEDLLVEEQACAEFKQPTPPAGEVCTDKRGAYAVCVLNSGADLCKSLVNGDSAAKKAIAATCGQPPL